MTTPLNLLLERTGTRLVEVAPEALGEDAARFCGVRFVHTDGTVVLAMPAGQRTEVREAVGRYLLTDGGAQC